MQLFFAPGDIIRTNHERFDSGRLGANKILIMIKLCELFDMYGSDKAAHGYASFYEKHLPREAESLLEIGVKEGASLRAWKNYFPSTKLYALDLFSEFGAPEDVEATYLKANQLDHATLYHIRNEIRPTIISEDASHNCSDHWVTMFSLIGTCKYYFIEDLHTCYEEFYRQGLTYEQTILGAMERQRFPFDYVLNEDKKIALIYGNAI